MLPSLRVLGSEFECGIQGTILANTAGPEQNDSYSGSLRDHNNFQREVLSWAGVCQQYYAGQNRGRTFLGDCCKVGHLINKKFLQQWLAYSLSLIHSHTTHVPKAVCQRACEQIALLINLLQKQNASDKDILLPELNVRILYYDFD